MRQEEETGHWILVNMNLKDMAHGASVLADWVGSGNQPVAAWKALARSSVCEGCPKNRSAKGWKDRVTAEAAKLVKAIFRLKDNAVLVVPNEEKLGVCSACDCPLKLKVWVPLDFIWDNTSERDLAKFVPKCWIMNEKR